MTEIRTIQYDDGRWCEQEYEGDKLHGRWTVFYASGTKEWERQHVDDRKEGYCKRWDENGCLVEEMWYHLNELHGAWRRWDEALAYPQRTTVDGIPFFGLCSIWHFSGP